MADPLLSPKEAADFLNVKEHYVRRLIFQKRIPVQKLGPGRNGMVRIKQSDLEDFLAKSRVEAAQ